MSEPTFDEAAIRQAIRMALRAIAEQIAAQLRAMADDPMTNDVSARNALLAAAAAAVISTNEKTWGKEPRA